MSTVILKRRYLKFIEKVEIRKMLTNSRSGFDHIMMSLLGVFVDYIKKTLRFFNPSIFYRWTVKSEILSYKNNMKF